MSGFGLAHVKHEGHTYVEADDGQWIDITSNEGAQIVLKMYYREKNKSLGRRIIERFTK